MIAIREALQTPWSEKSSAQMAESLGLTLDELKSKLQTLETLGLIEKSGSKWSVKDRVLHTPSEIKGFLASRYHREMISKAAESIYRFSIEYRGIGAVTFSLSESECKEGKEKLLVFQKSMSVS